MRLLQQTTLAYTEVQNERCNIDVFFEINTTVYAHRYSMEQRTLAVFFRTVYRCGKLQIFHYF